MKKILLMAAVVLSSVSAFAQHEVGSFNIQPKIGLNIANTPSEDETPNAKVGLAGGVEVEYQAADIFSISGGVLYSKQGCSLDDQDVEAEGFGYVKGKDCSLSLDYINFPIMANVYVVKGLAVKLGVQPGILVDAHNKFSVSANVLGISLNKDFKENIKDDCKTFDFSIPVGISYEYKNIQLDARYNWGLTKINEKGESTKNSVFQITLGYKLDL